MDEALKKLSILGWVQLITFALIFLSIAVRGAGAAWFNLPYDNGESTPIGSDAGFMWMYSLGGFTLIPSALTFIRIEKKPKTRSIDTAKTLQTVLFTACCIAFLPSFLGAIMIHSPGMVALLIACIAGLLFFPFQLAYTRDAKEAIKKLGLD